MDDWNIFADGALTYELLLCFHVDGWKGVGASAFLVYVAEYVGSTSDPRLQFDEVIRVRLPRKQSPRLVQRMIAEKLKLDPATMALFDEQDEDDEFEGVESGSRDPIDEVAEAIYQSLGVKRVLLLLSNLGIEIDIGKLGIIVARQSRNKMFFTTQWTLWQERADQPLLKGIDPRIYYRLDLHKFSTVKAKDKLKECLHDEASEIAHYINGIRCKSTLTPEKVLQCFWYVFLLRLVLHMDEVARVARYLVAEELIQGDEAWEIAEAVFEELKNQCLGPEFYWEAADMVFRHAEQDLQTREDLLHPSKLLKILTSREQQSGDVKDWKDCLWLAVEDDSIKALLSEGAMESSSNLSSLLLQSCTFPNGLLPDDFFQYASSLRVLVLSYTNISSLPPSILCLHNLRLLELRHCQKLVTLGILSSTSATCTVGRGKSKVPRQHLGRLQVLDLSHSSSCELPDDLFEHMQGLQFLDLSYNDTIESLPRSLSKAASLRMLILDGCSSLKTLLPRWKHLPSSIEEISLKDCISLRGVDSVGEILLPPMQNLRTFRHSGSEMITKLCLRGCRRLVEVELSDLPGLEELDLSGTAIKKLDPAVVNLPRLRRLLLLGCEHIKRVPWRDFRRFPEEFYLDQCGTVDCYESFQRQRAEDGVGVRMIVRDARIFRDLSNYKIYSLGLTRFHIHICSSVQGSTIEEIKIKRSREDRFGRDSFTYGDAYVVTQISSQDRPAPPVPLQRHLEIGGGTPFPSDIYGLLDETDSLFVHSDESTKSLTDFNARMITIKRCRIESCHRMDVVFETAWSEDALQLLGDIWASHLARVTAVITRDVIYSRKGCANLRHIFLEYCPRLKYVAYCYKSMLQNLETLRITYCDDLEGIFIPLYEDEVGDPMHLPKLRSIHLKELPKLKHICKTNISSPVLQELKFRGCSSLRRLPIFTPSHPPSEPLVVSCERDWWERLEWGGSHANHDSSLFEPHHSPHYKRRIQKTTW